MHKKTRKLGGSFCIISILYGTSEMFTCHYGFLNKYGNEKENYYLMVNIQNI